MEHVIWILVFFICTACNGQSKSKSTLVGGGCDGCELLYVGMPKHIPPVDTSDGWKEKGQRLHIAGRILQPGGKLPAAGVVLYYWQTDVSGYYSPGAATPVAAKRHGHTRGWVKTGADGTFHIYTNRPAPYPKDTMPAHIHVAIKEPSLNEYYIDEWVFNDDPLLKPSIRAKMENRGGNGIMKVSKVNGVQEVQQDVILGLHIPGYPR
ncbi:protocatechuate 3,4-dioxygenase beta subunit [Chitinophaga skermanii]|uniref:Protocatechuate 3,4-dioxygenase beta subunit n=1 Tax=Chitinophaga skermanii TaxID=331697 RepID=A0A327QLK0_9BACT|nr:intradiol ring-cleavage dioxygenase [Chitinophaga skermanii]RAJ05201.1 protocatechuate 3,4-dioxygenase beta subunit [Chitinophaga skermanii]